MTLRRTSWLIPVLLGLTGCSVDSILMLQLLDGADSAVIQVFDDSACGQPFQNDDGAMFAEDVHLDGPLEDGKLIGIPVGPSAQGTLVRIELELLDGHGGVERWCACPKLPPGGEVSNEIPVRAARGTPIECQFINLDDIKFGTVADGEACRVDFECTSQNCECANPSCTNQICAEAPCECGYLDQRICVEGRMPMDGDGPIYDPEDCVGDAECVGRACLLTKGSSGCSSNNHCATGHCACANEHCTETVCTESDCEPCQWLDDETNACTDSVANGEAVPNCGGACQDGACDAGAGLPRGELCFRENECQGDLNCVCENENCTSSVCELEGLCGLCEYYVGESADGGSCRASPVGNAGEGCGDGDQFPGGACVWDGVTPTCVVPREDGALCGADGPGGDDECLSGHCECTNDTCTQKKCGQVNCPCGYNMDFDDQCDGALNPGTDDAEDSCGDTSACAGDGACRLNWGEDCTEDSQCAHGHCECTELTCQEGLRCSQIDCDCWYNLDGDDVCDGRLDDGLDDAEPSCPAGESCFSGACAADQGEVCDTDSECAFRCWCANASCSVKKCTALDEPCTFDSDADGSPDGAVLGYDDPDDSCGAGEVCSGGRGDGCGLPLDTSCAVDLDCAHGNCECTEATCTPALKRCSEEDCNCEFNGDPGPGGDGCEEVLVPGTDDLDDPACPDPNQSCSVGGACGNKPGVVCSANAECAHGNCECVDPGCVSPPECSEADCDCGYNANNDSLCNAGWLDVGLDDPEDSCLVGHVCGAGGVCGREAAEPCDNDGDCAHGHCECANATCTFVHCSELDCDCQYNSNPANVGGDACEGPLTDGTDDPEDSCGAALACYGGVCMLDAGQNCNPSDNQCGSGFCECTTAGCGSTKCNPVACPCQFDTNWNDNDCEGNVDRGSDDANDTCGAAPDLTCDGQGGCHLDLGGNCGDATDCESDICADGRCCDAACSGVCDRCDKPGEEGTCVLDDTLCLGNCDQCNSSGGCSSVPGVCSGCADCRPDGDYYSCGPEPGDPLCSWPSGSMCAVCADTGDGVSWECAFDDTADDECPSGWICTDVNSCLAPVGATCAADSECISNRCNLQLGHCCSATSPCASNVSAGGSHTCVALAGGEVRCWGFGLHGRVGDGNLDPHTVTTPFAVNLPAQTWDLRAGGNFTCARLSSDSGVCWGNNDNGQLGSNTTDGRASITLPADLICRESGACPPGSMLDGISSLDAGLSHACATVALGVINDPSDDEVHCWGSNSVGQLGIGSTGGQYEAPEQVLLVGARAVATGEFHACAIRDSRAVWCWGWNNYGQLGNGTRTDTDLPVEVGRLGSSFSLSNIVQVSAGDQHTCVVDASGNVWCWGFNLLGQVGSSACVGGTGAGQPCAQDVQCPNGGTCAPVKLGTCSGGADDGETCWLTDCDTVGNCCASGSCFSVVTEAARVDLGDVPALHVSAGGSHTCAVLDNHTVWCWGSHQSGQLGVGSNVIDSTVVPHQVDASGFTSAVAVAAGGDHTCIVATDGSVWCWGSDESGQIGNGGGVTEDPVTTPVEVVAWP